METTNSTLTSRERFHLMLKHYPRLSGYWDESANELRYLEMKKAIGVLSRGEQIMARFYMSVWRGDNEGFDILDAAGTLDLDSKKIIISWMVDPFWP